MWERPWLYFRAGSCPAPGLSSRGSPWPAPMPARAAFESRLRSPTYQGCSRRLRPAPAALPTPLHPKSRWGDEAGPRHHQGPPPPRHAALSFPGEGDDAHGPLPAAPRSGGIAKESAIWDPRGCNRHLRAWVCSRPSVCLSLACWLAATRRGRAQGTALKKAEPL